jgi:hypothetical protein
MVWNDRIIVKEKMELLQNVAMGHLKHYTRIQVQLRKPIKPSIRTVGLKAKNEGLHECKGYHTCFIQFW